MARNPTMPSGSNNQRKAPGLVTPAPVRPDAVSAIRAPVAQGFGTPGSVQNQSRTSAPGKSTTSTLGQQIIGDPVLDYITKSGAKIPDPVGQEKSSFGAALSDQVRRIDDSQGVPTAFGQRSRTKNREV
jgi:hypothetical protein